MEKDTFSKMFWILIKRFNTLWKDWLEEDFVFIMTAAVDESNFVNLDLK